MDCQKRGLIMREGIRETVEALGKIAVPRVCCDGHACPPPDRQEIVKVIHELQALLFPMAFRREYPDMADETLLSRALNGFPSRGCRVRPLQREGVLAPVERRGVSCGGTRGGTANENSPSVQVWTEGFCLSL